MLKHLRTIKGFLWGSFIYGLQHKYCAVLISFHTAYTQTSGECWGFLGVPAPLEMGTAYLVVHYPGVTGDSVEVPHSHGWSR